MRELKLLIVVLATMLFTSGIAESAKTNRASPIPKLMPQLGHDQRLASVAFSPTGKQVLTGGNDAAAVLWDNATGREIRRFEIDRNSVWSVAFAAKGRQALVGSWQADLFDIQTGELIRSFPSDGLISAMAVSTDETRLLLTATNAASLWDLNTGKKLQRFEGNQSAISSVAFSSDGTRVITGGGYNPTNETRDIKDFTIRIWNAKTGKEQQQFVGHTGAISSVSLSPPDERYLLSASRDESVSRLWEVSTGLEIGQFQGSSGKSTGAIFSPNGKYVVTSSWPITLWDRATKAKVREFKGHKQEVSAVAFSPDGKQLVSASWDKTARLWDVDTGNEIQRFEGRSYSLSAVVFSADGRRILTAGTDNKAHLWSTQTGSEVQRYEGHGKGQYGYVDIPAVAMSADNRLVLTASNDGTARLWNAQTGEEFQVFEGHGKNKNGYYAVQSVAFSADDQQVLTGGDDGTARLWDVKTGEQLRLFKGHTEGKYGYSKVEPVAFLPDGRVLTSGQDGSARVWNIETEKEIRHFDGWKGEVIAFSPDGKTAMIRASHSAASLWDLEAGQKVWQITDQPYVSAVFSSDGKQILTVSGSNISDKTARLWDAATGDELQRFEGHTASLTAGAFSPDGTKVLTVSKDRTTRIWDTESGKELARLLSFDDGTWAVVDSFGRFDASNGGDIGGLHWVVGLEPIKLSQLKERYYEPGLLGKVLKLNTDGEGLREVEVFNKNGIALFPKVTVTHDPSPDDPVLRVRLENRGGGIGKIQILVNGKEVTEDARPRGSNDQETAVLELEVDLTNNPLMIPGVQNAIEVVAYNGAGYLASSPRGRPKARVRNNQAAEAPALWALVVGVSEYRGNKIDLNYAAKDADDFANALKIAANGHKGFKKVNIMTLTDSTTPATRDNLKNAFESLKKAKPTDILVVYLAGHGITWGGAEGDYYYLLQDASSMELKDKVVREQVAVSSRELTEWIKAVPALKQAFILDTCASGQAILSLTASRTVSASQTRSLDRMKDRTGMFVLAGSAADAVSYEASEYGQGLLTYSLLEGMKGAALGIGGFVDVQKLFSHAIERVPQLAGDLGGIQQPRLAVPRGGESFDVGQLQATERDQIPLSQKRPLVLRTRFEDAKLWWDKLKFADKVNGALREISSSGRDAPLVFVETDEFSNAYLLSGRYSVNNDLIEVTVKVFKGEKKIRTFKVQGHKRKLADLASQVAKHMQKIVKKDH
jgi:WD40 repeat protein